MAFSKKSVDSAAKAYFKLLWEEYGEDLVRDIPRRIKAALQSNKKVASVSDSAMILPIAHGKSDDGCLLLEGVFNDGAARLVFHASFDKEGNVVDVKSFNLV